MNDEADNDPVRFWNYIKASFAQCLKDEEILKDVSVNAELVTSNIETAVSLGVKDLVIQQAVSGLPIPKQIH